MSEETDGEITLTIHGLDAFNGEVDGEVFARKFSAFMKGLALADLMANGERRHQFMISALVKNTATASVAEREFKAGPPRVSSVGKYEDSIEEIRRDSAAARLLPSDFVRTVATLNKGVGSKFEFGEIKIARGDGNVIRIDSFLAERAAKVLRDIERQAGSVGRFAGTAFGSFDGILKAVDYQPEMKRGILRLTAGGLPIQCNITNVAVEDVADALEKRAVAYGLAHYDGRGGLPKLLDIQRIEVINRVGDLSRWRGNFEVPDADEDWGDH